MRHNGNSKDETQTKTYITATLDWSEDVGRSLDHPLEIHPEYRLLGRVIVENARALRQVLSCCSISLDSTMLYEVNYLERMFNSDSSDYKKPTKTYDFIKPKTKPSDDPATRKPFRLGENHDDEESLGDSKPAH